MASLAHPSIDSDIPSFTDLSCTLPGFVGAALFSRQSDRTVSEWSRGEAPALAFLDRLMRSIGGWPAGAFEFVIAAERSHVVVGLGPRVLVLQFQALTNIGLAVGVAQRLLESR